MDILYCGQVGFRFEYDGQVFFIDPYFSNSVEEKEDSSIKRLIPIPLQAEEQVDVDFVLITHAHRDHCDPDTLIPLSEASPQCQFYGPAPVISVLENAGIFSRRLHLVTESAFEVNGLNLFPVPSAHPQVKKDYRGGWQSIGYMWKVDSKRFYHPGDTAVSPEVIMAVTKIGPVDFGMIPVNEINYYRDKDNIIGNMSVREAFQFAEEIGVKKFIPTHWDMFAKNQVYKEEIELLYAKIQPKFDLVLLEVGMSYVG